MSVRPSLEVKALSPLVPPFGPPRDPLLHFMRVWHNTELLGTSPKLAVALRAFINSIYYVYVVVTFGTHILYIVYEL